VVSAVSAQRLIALSLGRRGRLQTGMFDEILLGFFDGFGLILGFFVVFCKCGIKIFCFFLFCKYEIKIFVN
jgi:hypothetical protein